MGLEDVGLPVSLCPCRRQLAKQAGKIHPHACAPFSQAWQVFTPLAGRDDSPEQMLQLRYFLNENLFFFVPIQIYKGRGETSKKPVLALAEQRSTQMQNTDIRNLFLHKPKLRRNT